MLMRKVVGTSNECQNLPLCPIPSSPVLKQPPLLVSCAFLQEMRLGTCIFNFLRSWLKWLGQRAEVFQIWQRFDKQFHKPPTRMLTSHTFSNMQVLIPAFLDFSKWDGWKHWSACAQVERLNPSRSSLSLLLSSPVLSFISSSEGVHFERTSFIEKLK